MASFSTSKAPSTIRLIELAGISIDGASAEGLEACRALRRAVFIKEQGVPEAIEWDGLDGEAQHFLAVDSAEALRSTTRTAAVGTARMRIVDGQAKAERVAVREDVRTRGVGRLVMLAVEAHARRQGFPAVVLHAQVIAIPFYERLGYQAHGEIFLDAGIDHREMTKSLG